MKYNHLLALMYSSSGNLWLAVGFREHSTAACGFAAGCYAVSLIATFFGRSW